MNRKIVVAESPSFTEAVRTFARIGFLSFGGPAGQIALMHRILVDEKRWISESRYLHALSYCMLLPGPEAMQLATYIGWLLHGIRGGVAAGLLFVLPGAAVITALSAVYLLFGHIAAVQGILFGLKAAVLAVVLEALIRISRRALKSRLMMAIAVGSFVGIALLKLPFPLIISAAALVGASVPARAKDPPGDQGGGGDDPTSAGSSLPDWAKPSGRRFVLTLAIWLAIWFGPLLALYQFHGGGVFTQEAVFFSKMATVTFGGAYAVLAYVAQQAVEVHGWLRPDEMLTGLGLAETTPGPLILVLVFVGFLGGARFAGMGQITGGLAGAGVTLWFTYVPCFLWIFLGAPYVETIRNVRWLTNALAAVTAAVVGVIANLAAWFGLHVLFAQVGALAWGPFSLPVVEVTSFDAVAMAIALGAGVALLRYHANMILVLMLAAVAGMAWRLAA